MNGWQNMNEKDSKSYKEQEVAENADGLHPEGARHIDEEKQQIFQLLNLLVDILLSKAIGR